MTGTGSALKSLVVGCGHAGRDLHLAVLHRHRHTNIGVVDRLFEPDCADPRLPLAQFRRLDEVIGFPPEQTVVHVCTGPRDHVSIVRDASAHGYRQFVVEKPLATCVADADHVLDLTRRLGLDVLVVANWLSSSLTDRVAERLREARLRPISVVMRQHKSRIGTSLASTTHDLAFDVEMPHLVALALHLFGPELTLDGADLQELRVGHVVRPGLGAARIRLRTTQGVPLMLESFLDAPISERSITARYPDGSEIRGYYPVDSRDFYSQLIHVDPAGRMTDRELLVDQTLDRFLREAYAWFEGRGQRPISDAHLHRSVVDVLDLARNDARTRPRPRPAVDAPAPSWIEPSP
ncbi:MAG: Gfo/Idh/MocA family oxidoreductase [Nocardioides sp.]|uniref:Gfo/Idh/MocA family oxidoreductase n=1 Tax=Nocardioides sp. TaxID=35761 RepID=UPI0039E40CE2